ncbi:DUF3575 domain-containing protein [Flavobacterium sp. PL11]|uniref:DUF3575 domain-containing protein n=1 Tax=Flavobacterium sp. PL11 TaxID=3071717 RepID=UPI002E10B4A6
MKKNLLSALVILFNICVAFAQTTTSVSGSNSLVSINEASLIKKNNVKISLTSLAFKNYQFQYERSLTKRIGVVVGYSFISKGSIAFKRQLSELTSDNEDNKKILDNAQLGYSAFTPEVRIYLGEGYGKGFYIAPFYRNLKYDITDVTFTFKSDLGPQEDIDMGGKLTANTFGLQLGAQFNLGKHIILDWWIVGPHYGTAKGNFDGKTDRTLTSFEQAELQKELDDIDLPLGDIEAKANRNGATIKISGPWGGIRSGISLGYRF